MTTTTADKGELLPCPFCGGPVELEQTIDHREWWGVVCRNTRNVGGTCAIQQHPSASKEAAIARWNRRATTAQTTPAGEGVELPDAITFLRDSDLAASDDWMQGWNDLRSIMAEEIAKRDTERAGLRTELAHAGLQLTALRAQLAEAEKDARNWRQYQARKQAIIAAGMGKNPLRDAALSSPAQARTHDQG